MIKNLTQNSHFISACKYADLGRFRESLDILQGLEDLFSDDAILYFLMGMCDYKMLNLIRSKERLNKCLQINPNLTQANHLLGNVLRDLEEFELAILAYKREININPQYPDVLNDLGILFFMRNQLNEASDVYDHAISLDAKYADPYQNKAMIYIRRKKFKEAEELLDVAIKLKANNYEAIATLANLKKHICEFDSAWQLYQHRFELELKDEKRFFKKPAWTEKLIGDKKIYLYSEQGIGDQILYGTMFKEAFETKNNFIISIDERLIPIFNRSFSHYKNIKFISKDDVISESLFDMHLAVGDLGNFFRRRIEDVANFSYPYFVADKERTGLIQKKIRNENKIICGISWRSASQKIGLDKSIDLIGFKDILSREDLMFVDLQYGDTLAERNQLKNEYGLTINKLNEIDNFNDIDGLTSLIDACNFVITSSNVTAHIAGALNKKTYLVVPYSAGRCWYWHDGLTKSLWYPSVEIFTQNEAGDWSLSINEIKEKIAKEIAHV